MPGGAPRAFWASVIAMSTCQSSMQTTSPPIEVTPSSTKRASALAASRPTPDAGFKIPVEVSLCTIVTRSVAGVIAAATVSMSNAAPQGTATRSTCAYRSAMRAKRSPNLPLTSATTRSSGPTRFETAASIPSVAVPFSTSAVPPSGGVVS